MSEEERSDPPLLEEDSQSTATSLGEDKSNHFEPTRDTLSEGILSLLRPTLESIDTSVADTRQAQTELKTQIEKLTADLEEIAKKQDCPVKLETYVDKLHNSKRKVLVVSNILQGAQERLNRIHQLSMKETAKRRTLLEPSDN
ncbi:SNAPIN protein homolog [Lepeophtheirus salmonis]|uniref:SNAPIN protein homolog n=1 Tax=Lepeophtheirus salmonis TaxID=72036 RepID=UPI001AE4BE0E|nr:SNAPIN protein homolog [Lepeophtheirus salmonis]